MGYANTIPSSYAEVYSIPLATSGFDHEKRNYALSDILIPSFGGKLDYAYLDFICQGWYNSTAALNEITSTSFIGLKDTGGTTRNGGNITSTTISLPANYNEYCTTVLAGTTNLKQYISSGATQTIVWGDVQCTADFIFVRGIMGRLRLYFNII